MTTTSVITAETLLAIDIGTVTTRAYFFDAVSGAYRFIAMGKASSTLDAPFSDPSEGIHNAIDNLHNITSRDFFNESHRLIIPATADNAGVDSVVVTLSGGPAISVIAVGLLEDVSLNSVRNLVNTINAEIVDTISLNDRRKLEKRLDSIIRLRPDLVVVGGGTDDGASKSVMKLLEAVGLACYLLPNQNRPVIMYIGNPKAASEAEKSFDNITKVYVAPNVRPTLEVEQLSPAQGVLRQVYREFHTRKSVGLQESDGWTDHRLMPSSMSYGRVIRFLSRYYRAEKGVLGIDLGAGGVTLAAAFQGDLRLQLDNQIGMGCNLPQLLKRTSVDNIGRWLPFEIAPADIRDYIYHKAAYPSSVPAEEQDLHIELAIAREVLRTSMRKFRPALSATYSAPGPGLLPWFEPIIVSGATITEAPTRGQAMLTILDGLAPTGISTIVLDQFNMLASLGAAAELNALLAVQVLEAGALINLGTVVAPVSAARTGTPILRIRYKLPGSSEKIAEFKKGALTVIPLRSGQTAQLQLEPLGRTDIGMGGTGRGGSMRVVGGEFGLVIDARGRPVAFPKDPLQRRETLQKWQHTLGAVKK